MSNFSNIITIFIINSKRNIYRSDHVACHDKENEQYRKLL